MDPILIRLGLTPAQIVKFVVRIEPPLAAGEIATLLKASTEGWRKQRAAWVAAGLTTKGTPRKRSPNGTRLNYYQRRKLKENV
jgi:hypothetical protein